MILSCQLVCWRLQTKGLKTQLGSLLTQVWFASGLIFSHVSEICHANFQALKWLILLGLKGQASISELGGGGKSEPNVNVGTLGLFDVGGPPTCERIVTHDQGGMGPPESVEGDSISDLCS